MSGVLPPAPSSLRSIDDLLTPEQRERLAADLREIAACRRRALDAAATTPMGSQGEDIDGQ